jgi:hypothetical protein
MVSFPLSFLTCFTDAAVDFSSQEGGDKKKKQEALERLVD